MKKSILIWGAGLCLIVLAAFVTNHYQMAEPELTAIAAADTDGDNAPDQAVSFQLTDLSGQTVDWQNLQGKKVYMKFWATWCKWCVKEMPELNELVKQYENRDDVVVITVDVGEKLDKVEGFLAESDYDFPVLFDFDKQVTKSYGIKSLPASLFINTKGEIAHKRIGTMDAEKVVAAIEALD